MNPILVLKFGTASITKSNGELDDLLISSIAHQVSEVSKDYRVILVSSGAVGAGKKYISKFTGDLTQRKAAAAIGNPILMGLYAQKFKKYGIPVAQSLCERSLFANRTQFLQLKETYETLWESGIIPIANENDVVSNQELKFSDNDELATLLAAGFGAKILLFSTSVGGLLDGRGKIISKVNGIKSEIWKLVDSSKSALGLGGMLSKLSFAHKANQLGIKVIIFGLNGENSLSEALAGKEGTQFIPKNVNRNARQKWLSTGSLISGKLVLDTGAERAIQKRKSLLAVGVSTIEGKFEAGEVIELFSAEGHLVATAQSRISSSELEKNLQTKNLEVAHADQIVVY